MNEAAVCSLPLPWRDRADDWNGDSDSLDVRPAGPTHHPPHPIWQPPATRQLSGSSPASRASQSPPSEHLEEALIPSHKLACLSSPAESSGGRVFGRLPWLEHCANLVRVLWPLRRFLYSRVRGMAISLLRGAKSFPQSRPWPSIFARDGG